MTEFDDGDVAEFRRRAAEWRTKAQSSTDPVVRRECLILAEAWNQFIAEVLKGRSPQGSE